MGRQDAAATKHMEGIFVAAAAPLLLLISKTHAAATRQQHVAIAAAAAAVAAVCPAHAAPKYLLPLGLHKIVRHRRGPPHATLGGP